MTNKKFLLNMSVLPLSKRSLRVWIQEYLVAHGPVVIDDIRFSCAESALGSWHNQYNIEYRVSVETIQQGYKLVPKELLPLDSQHGEMRSILNTAIHYQLSGDILKKISSACSALEEQAISARKIMIQELVQRFHTDKDFHDALIEERNSVALTLQSKKITEYCSQLTTIKDNIEAVIRDLTGEDKNAVIEGIMDPKKMKALGNVMKHSVELNASLQESLSKVMNNYNKIINSKKPRAKK